MIVGVVADLPNSVRPRPPMLDLLSTCQPRRQDVGVDPNDRCRDPAGERSGPRRGLLALEADRRRRSADNQELFLAQSRASLYLDLTIQSATAGIGAGLAVMIACLGLFALSAYTTERRTKEIGVRKAMGADTLQVVLLLLWQFTVPVLAAVALAIPVGVLAMGWWLKGFTYHVDLSAWTFVLAAAAGVLIAWLTVSWQSFAVARAKPVGALRYE